MPAPPPKSPQEGLSGPPLWTLTAVLVLVSGLLFYFAQAPLAQAFDVLKPEPPQPAPVVADDAPPPPPEPDAAPPPPPPPPEPWTRAEIDAAVAQAADGVLTLLEEARAELPTYADLGSADEAQAQRAAARFGRWGNVWRNRVEVYRAELPPLDLCVPVDPEPAAEPPSDEAADAEESADADAEEAEDADEIAGAEEAIEPLTTAEACVELHAILGDLDAVAEARTYDGALQLLEVVEERREEPRLVATVGERDLSE